MSVKNLKLKSQYDDDDDDARGGKNIILKSLTVIKKALNVKEHVWKGRQLLLVLQQLRQIVRDGLRVVVVIVLKLRQRVCVCK